MPSRDQPTHPDQPVFYQPFVWLKDFERKRVENCITSSLIVEVKHNIDCFLKMKQRPLFLLDYENAQGCVPLENF